MDTTDLVMQLLTLYGPLAMGWVMWWIEKRSAQEKSDNREDLLREALENSTVAITTLAERLRGAMSRRDIIQ